MSSETVLTVNTLKMGYTKKFNDNVCCLQYILREICYGLFQRFDFFKIKDQFFTCHGYRVQFFLLFATCNESLVWYTYDSGTKIVFEENYRHLSYKNYVFNQPSIQTLHTLVPKLYMSEFHSLYGIILILYCLDLKGFQFLF